jgi:hypothetical protein
MTKLSAAFLVSAGLAALSVRAPAQAATFDFSFVGLDDPSIFGSGVLTTSNGGSPYTVTGATGTITDPSGTFSITGLSGYAGADNLLYDPPSAGFWYVSFGGISFTTNGAPDFNLGGGGTETPQFNVLNNSVLNPTGLPLGDGQTVGSYNIDITVTQIPESSTWAMLCLGFAGLGLVALRRRKAPVSALG